ncbi:MAG TPA: sulfotransferase [Rhizomicrobium sp.]|nr:sulfotransferase [Rhizomicrobium sp.]
MVSAPTNQQKADQTVPLIAAAIRGGDYDRAAHLADTVLALGLHHPIVYNARALAFQQKGQHREALTEFNRARQLTPDDPHLLNAVGVCLINLNQPLDAIRIFDDAIRADAGNAQAHYRKGWTLEMLGERAQAQASYERAIAIDANHADALGSLAGMLATVGETAKSRAFAERALKSSPHQASAIVALGIVDLAERKFREAERRFQSVLDTAPLTLRAAAVVRGLLGDAFDGQDRIDEAFASYRFEKNEMRKLYAQNYASQQRPRETADRITAFVKTSAPVSWSRPADETRAGARPKTHVFLLGFARSGTTLLEQVFASHADVVALEEKDLLAEPANALLTGDAGLRKLATLTAKEIADYRDAYWRGVKAQGLNVDGKVFIDKLPLNTLKLPLIARLFPEAKIIFALRDPRDVLLSCYRRHFDINAANFEFLTLDDAAPFYASVMALAAACRETLPLAQHVHRYEDMIQDFDKSIAAACEFVGIKWSPAMRDFHTQERLPVVSPSAAQIRRPLNADSLGAWRRYRDHLRPILPQLRPWVERFGYPAE